MHASECKRQAEICFQLARELPPTYQPFLFEMAENWLKAAKELDREEGQHPARGAEPRR